MGDGPDPGPDPGPGMPTGAAARPVLVVVGMRAEARLLPPEACVLCSAGDAVRLAALLGGLGRDFAGVLSFGIAGGLDPGLAAGTVVVPAAVRAGGRTWRTDAGWSDALCRRYGAARRGAIVGHDGIVATPAAKRALRAESGAIAVDMESAAAAAFAAERALPFAVLRAVADRAADAVPPAALRGLRPDGSADLPGVLASLLRHPGQLPGLIRIGRSSRRALRALGRVPPREILRTLPRP